MAMKPDFALFLGSSSVDAAFTFQENAGQSSASSTPYPLATYQFCNAPVRSATLTNKGSSASDLQQRYAALIAAISALRKLPVNDRLHIDEETAARSFLLLSLLRDRNAPPPQLFPQDGEAMNFTWDVGQVRKFITIAADEFSELDLHRTAMLRCEQDLPEFGTEEWSAWLQSFAGPPEAETPDVR